MDCANCTWAKANHTNVVAAPLTCGDFTPVVAAERNEGPTLSFVPDRCPKCHEALTPKVTKGSYKCKCDQPRPPRWVLEQAGDKPLTGQVRYGN
jgi:hypothetical protein